MNSAGTNILLPCLFHDDSRASLAISLENGVWICHAGCGKGTWLEFLSRATADRDWQPLEEASKNAPRPADVKNLEPLLARGFTPAMLQDWEIIWDDDNGAILIPAYWPDGSYVAPIWRTVGNTKGPKYLHAKGFPRREILFGAHKALVAAEKTVVLVEGPLDAIWAQAAGVPAVGLLGSALSEGQLHALCGMGKRTVTLCLDNDPAGNSAAYNIYPLLQRQGMWVRRAWLPAGAKDIQDVPLEAVKGVIDKAELAVNGTGFFHSTLRRFVAAPMNRTAGASPYRY